MGGELPANHQCQYLVRGLIVSNQTKKHVGGHIAYYDLQDWWYSAFDDEEREFISQRYQPISIGGLEYPLVQGRLSGHREPHDKQMFLFALAGWFNTPETHTIRDRIYEQLRHVARSEPRSAPGFVRGRYFGTWVEEIKQLKRDGELNSAREILSEALDAIEAESEQTLNPPPPWYYDQLRIVFKKLGMQQEAQEVMIRYAKACENRSPRLAWEKMCRENGWNPGPTSGAR